MSRKSQKTNPNKVLCTEADELETCQTIPEVAQKTRNQEDMQSKQL